MSKADYSRPSPRQTIADQSILRSAVLPASPMPLLSTSQSNVESFYVSCPFWRLQKLLNVREIHLVHVNSNIFIINFLVWVFFREFFDRAFLTEFFWECGSGHMADIDLTTNGSICQQNIFSSSCTKCVTGTVFRTYKFTFHKVAPYVKKTEPPYKVKPSELILIMLFLCP